jgi:hypothetical protein
VRSGTNADLLAGAGLAHAYVLAGGQPDR